MRLATFLDCGRRAPALVCDGALHPFRGVATLIEYIAMPPKTRAGVPIESRVGVAEVALDVPVRPAKNIFCVGRNYVDHAAEIARRRGVDLKLPRIPTFFTKAPTALAAPEQTLELSPSLSHEYDWEAELAIVIGRRCRDVAESRALDVVFGYTCLNDVTARDLQRDHGQWFKGKSLDATCPLGPWIVTVDELGEANDLDISLRLNGTVKQQSNTRKMIFGVREIIASLSRGLTLEPGDVIATGTPEGVGFARTPSEFLHDGDVMEVDIGGIGVLRNRVALQE